MVINKIGYIPALNETLQIAGLNITISEKDGHKLKRLKIEKLP